MPVTQQYVKRSDGKYALIDLYFPQINYGIECDEAYHISNTENDKVRVLTMEDMLSSVDETKDFLLRRVSAYTDIISINKQIYDIVSEIKYLLTKREIVKWDIDFDHAEYAIKNKRISVQDRLQFSTIIELAKCFGKEYKNMQHSFFSVGHGYYIWCPKLAIYNEGQPTAVSNGWINLLSDDWERISERNENSKALEWGPRFENIKKITFAKSKDPLGFNTYRFIGVFSYSRELSSKDENIHVREATTIELGHWINKK